MVGGRFLIDIKNYQFNLKSEKINSIARLVKLGIPTVPFPHVLLPENFKFYLKNKKLSAKAIRELEAFFSKLQKIGYPVTVRPSIYADIPGAEFIVRNNINLPTLKEVVQAIVGGYDKVIKEFGRLDKIEFAHLLQGFYTANKAGVVFSDDGLGYVYIEAAFGENTNIFTRGKVQPDIYRVDRLTGEVRERKIAEKKFTLEVSESGLRKVRLMPEERIKPVFTDEEIKKICQYALRMEKEYGPQEIECAVLRTGELIFQSSRSSKIRRQKTALSLKNVPIFSKEVEAKAIYLNDLKRNRDLSQKIVVTGNLDIDFITKLVYRFKPKGVILTRGSLTAHAVTILREAKVPSVLVAGFKLGRQKLAAIKANGEVQSR